MSLLKCPQFKMFCLIWKVGKGRKEGKVYIFYLKNLLNNIFKDFKSRFMINIKEHNNKISILISHHAITV